MPYYDFDKYGSLAVSDLITEKMNVDCRARKIRTIVMHAANPTTHAHMYISCTYNCKQLKIKLWIYLFLHSAFRGTCTHLEVDRVLCDTGS